MLNAITKITVAQKTQAPGYAVRNNTIAFGFVHEFEITSTWRDLSDKGKITLPKNVYIRDDNNRLVSLAGSQINLGGFLPGPATTGGTTAGVNGAPVFMRGDKICIACGYTYFNSQGTQVAPIVEIFSGYITKVSSHKPFELEVMDNMYILQQTQAPVKEWVGYTVGGMLEEMIYNAGLNFAVSDQGPTGQGAGTSLGNYRTGNETIAQALARLRKDYNYEAFFKQDVLYCGTYFYNDAQLASPPYPTFTFQQNIIKDDLSYARMDDITVSEVASTALDTTTGETTKDGQAKTKKQSLQVLVTFKAGSTTPVYFYPKPGNPLPDNTEGERKTGFFPQAKTIEDLQARAVSDLKKFYYEGYKGKFTTFGQPFIRHGDVITIADNILPERNGNYRVRGVTYSGGTGGLRQEIELDYKVS